MSTHKRTRSQPDPDDIQSLKSDPEFQPMNVVIGLIRMHTYTLKDLLAYREVNSQYKLAVDKYVADVWARVLTAADITRGFERAQDYIVHRAWDAKVWYEGQSAETFTNDRGLEETRIVKHSSLFAKVPDVETYPYADQFIQNRHQSIDDFFISIGFLDKQAKYGFTALYIAIEHDPERALYLLSKNCSIKTLKTGAGAGNPYLILAAEQNVHKIVPVVKELIARGADVNEPGKSDMPALATCVDIVLPYLLSLRATNVNYYSEYQGCSVLMYRLKKGKTYMPLVEAGADVKTLDSQGNTVLYFAKPEDYRFFVQKGVDLNHRNNKGETALLFRLRLAKTNQEARDAIKLMNMGTDPNIGSDDGELPLDFAFLHDLYFPSNMVLTGANPFKKGGGKGHMFEIERMEDKWWNELFQEVGETLKVNRYSKTPEAIEYYIHRGWHKPPALEPAVGIEPSREPAVGTGREAVSAVVASSRPPVHSAARFGSRRATQVQPTGAALAAVSEPVDAGEQRTQIIDWLQSTTTRSFEGGFLQPSNRPVTDRPVFDNVNAVIQYFHDSRYATEDVVSERLSDIDLKKLLTHFNVPGRGNTNWRKANRIDALRAFRKASLFFPQ